MLAQKKGLTDFSGFRADKEYWVHERQNAEKDILRVKAHEKSLSAISEVEFKRNGKPAQTSGNSDGSVARLRVSTTGSRESCIRNAKRLERHN